MNCPNCGTAVTHVLETRNASTMATRRHQCGNGCRPFKTVQFHAGIVHHMRRPVAEIRAQLQRGIDRKKREYDRGIKIARYLLAGHTNVEAAEKFGVHVNTVSRAKRKHLDRLKAQHEQ